MQAQVNMNPVEQEYNLTFPPNKETLTLFNLTTTMSSTISTSPSYLLDSYDPQFTIMVVLGLSLLFAGLAAFLAVCRPSEEDEDTSCGPGESLTCGRSESSEPQLKVWKRLGSYRRSYNLSFRRPPHRRPLEGESTQSLQSLALQTVQPEASTKPHLPMPCLFDYVTEI